jgi:hypothetical protein
MRRLGCSTGQQLAARLVLNKTEQSLAERAVRCALKTSLPGRMLSVREGARTWALLRMPAAAPCDVHCQAARG